MDPEGPGTGRTYLSLGEMRSPQIWKKKDVVGSVIKAVGSGDPRTQDERACTLPWSSHTQNTRHLACHTAAARQRATPSRPIGMYKMAKEQGKPRTKPALGHATHLDQRNLQPSGLEHRDSTFRLLRAFSHLLHPLRARATHNDARVRSPNTSERRRLDPGWLLFLTQLSG